MLSSLSLSHSILRVLCDLSPSSILQVLSKLCGQPIAVYIPEHEHTSGGWGSGFIPIAEYGSEFTKGCRNKEPRKVVRLLYSGRNHYDLLV
ncbi:unnamed protein product [Malus baccata var. baccata]